MPVALTYYTFESLLNTGFLVQVGGGDDQELVLIESEKLTPFPAGRVTQGREPFSLVFRGPVGGALQQRTYTLEHKALGVMEIFLVPIAPDAAGPRYEAVFN